VQESARHNIEVVLRGLQAASDAAESPPAGSANGAAIDPHELDKSVEGKNAAISRALAGGADASPALLDASTEVVRVLKQVFDGAKGLGGMVRCLPATHVPSGAALLALARCSNSQNDGISICTQAHAHFSA
jgi:hypothetical protein